MIFYDKILFGWLGRKQSTISFFLNLDLPDGKTVQIFDLTNEWTLNDSCSFRISTSNLPFLVVFNLPLINRVKLISFTKLFLKTAFTDFSFSTFNDPNRYGKTKNLKHATDEIGLPGRPKKTFFLFLNLANKIGLPGLIATFLK